VGRESALRFEGGIADVSIMLALSIRQPYAELILRGVKTVEYRSRPTRVIGEEFYIYAARGRGRTPPAAGLGAEEAPRQIWSDDLAVTDRADGTAPPPWMLELGSC
jgi:ASCH domain